MMYLFFSHTYFGEYPLSFAACLGHKDPVMYLLRRKACPNKKDTNGNTVLHMVVIHDRPVSIESHKVIDLDIIL